VAAAAHSNPHLPLAPLLLLSSSVQVLLTGLPLLMCGYLHTSASSPSSSSFHRRLQAFLAPFQSALFDFHFSGHKRALFSSLRGDVVELSPSSGSNFGHYPRSLVYSAVEPNPFLLSSLASAAATAGFPAGTLALSHTSPLHGLRAIPTSSKDAVIACEVLSKARASESEWAEIVSEVHRVLKPSGRFYFIDYTAHNRGDRVHRGVQALLSPLTRLTRSDLTLTRPIAQLLAANELEWDTVYMETWSTSSSQPLRLQWKEKESEATVGGGGSATESESGVHEREVTGLKGFMPVVAGICVKKKAESLSQYVSEGSGSMLEEVLQYGTLRRRPQAFTYR
jgi:SAM-dependent methyltransferase